MQLHKQGLITEVHLWDFTYGSQAPDKKLDQKWIHEKVNKYYFVKLFSTKIPKNRRPYRIGYYSYYARNNSHDDIILKVDDDIIWINISEFKCFIKFVAESTTTTFVSANIVNNGVIAHFQKKLGSIPSSVGEFEYPDGGAGGSLWKSPQKALKLHQYFLSQKSAFFKNNIVLFKERLSINFFAFTGRHAKDIFNFAKLSPDDEQAITIEANKNGAFEVVYMRLVVVHATFAKQRILEPGVVDKILQLYSNM